jgi:hypothetical protein
MSQVFLNLLKNAGEAIEKTGTITLRTQQKNGHVAVEVIDTGRGMPDEVRQKLFEPFFTTEARWGRGWAGPVDQRDDRPQSQRPHHGQQPPGPRLGVPRRASVLVLNARLHSGAVLD